MNVFNPVFLQVEMSEAGSCPQRSEVLQEVVIEVQHRETAAVGQALLCQLEETSSGNSMSKIDVQTVN